MEITESTTVAELRLLSLAEVIGEFIPQVEPATSQRYGPFGNVFLRPMFFAGAGSAVWGHKHNFDHYTLIARGSVLAEFQLPDGEKFERVYTADARVVEIAIKKDVIHKFTALTDEVIAICVYALRDLNTGEVVDFWDGGMESYQ